jgi:hypothetical protein
MPLKNTRCNYTDLLFTIGIKLVSDINNKIILITATVTDTIVIT